MNISEYDKFLEITDNTSSDEWYPPSEFDIIKDPPTKFETTTGAPTETSKILLREPAAFVKWAYLCFFAYSRVIKTYNPFDIAIFSTNTHDNTITSATKYLYRSLYCSLGVLDSYNLFLDKNLKKIVVSEPFPGYVERSLAEITDAELESKYPDYAYIGKDLASGSPLTSRIANALANRVRLAKDILNGGFDGYEYQDLILTTPVTTSMPFISLTRNCLATRSTSDEDPDKTKITFTLTQTENTIVGSVGNTPLIDITMSRSDIETTVVIYLDLDFDYYPTYGYKTSDSGKYPSVKYPSRPDTVYKHHRYEFTFKGSKTITTGDVGISSFNALINRAKSELNCAFSILNSVNYYIESTTSTEYETKGSAEFGRFTVGASYTAFIKHKFPIPN